MMTIFLSMNGFHFSDPGGQAHYSQHKEYNILHTGKYGAFIKIEWYRGHIGNDPPDPVLHFFSCHLPHTRIGRSRSKRISPKNKTKKKTKKNKKQHDPAQDKKGDSDQPVFSGVVRN